MRRVWVGVGAASRLLGCASVGAAEGRHGPAAEPDPRSRSVTRRDCGSPAPRWSTWRDSGRPIVAFSAGMSAALASAKVPDRFVIERALGSGAFGVVFVVWDREREERLALKRLERIDPASVYRFKKEFRALADLAHPNLVRLHELFALDDGWCFTMNLVEGVRFDAWVRGVEHETAASISAEALRSSRVGSTDATLLELPESGVVSSPAPEGSLRPPCDFARLRHATRQLVQGVLALHAAGILHRDLKPSNVLVDRDGRVVILDFGLAATGVVDAHVSVDGVAIGTPAYMSPEQACGAPLTTASDFYAIGAMIYEALCGSVPFDGPVTNMLSARISRDVPDPRLTLGELPDDLCDLCLALLRRDPARRPSGAELAARLALEGPASVRPKAPASSAFVGRAAELAELRRAFAITQSGRTVVAHVHGPSGYGKTTVVRRFLAELAAPGGVVVLEGRCYERESVPFKAFDELMDALGRYLQRLPPVEAAGLVPRDARALLRLFPALGRLELMTSVAGRAPTSDPHELRRRAFGAVREILARIGDTSPVVLFIDDVQWADADSALLVRDLLAPPDPPQMLLIVGYRGDGPGDNELLRALRRPEAVDMAWETVDVPIAALAPDEAESLAKALLGTDERLAAQCRAIASESAGSPWFVAELAHVVSTRREPVHEVSLQLVVSNRTAALSDDARLLLELLAVSESPLEERELRVAAELDAPRVAAALDSLRDEHLVNASVRRGQTTFEILHDKLRVAICEGLDPERARLCHGRLAATLEQAGSADPGVLAHHFRAAGDADKARLWYERAGDQASQGTAFERAAALYRRAIEGATGVDARRVTHKLAQSLASAGRGAEAARAFLSVAAELNADAAVELQQRAAEQFLRAGHVAESLDVFGPLLARTALAFPRTPDSALASLLFRRMRLKLRGIAFQERPASEIPQEELRRIDLCWSLGTGLAGIDLIRSAHYHATSLWLSLESGEPSRVVRALSMEGIMKALESAEGVARATELARHAEAIAQRVARPDAHGWAAAVRAVVAWGSSRFEDCVRECDEAASLLREGAERNFREIASLQIWFALHSLFLLGDLKRFAERAPAWARDAEARGDRYTLSTVRAYELPLLWAVRDRPEDGRREADAAIEVWPKDCWYHQHWARLRAYCFLDLYEGEGARILDRVEQSRALMKRSLQLRIRTPRFELNYVEGRGALAAAGSSDASARLAPARLRSLVRDRIQRLESEDSGLASAYAQALRAGLAALDDPARARAEFSRARSTFQALSMPLHVAAADYRISECSGEPSAARQETEQRLADRGVAAPRRFIDLLLPAASRRGPR